MQSILFKGRSFSTTTPSFLTNGLMKLANFGTTPNKIKPAMKPQAKEMNHSSAPLIQVETKKVFEQETQQSDNAILGTLAKDGVDHIRIDIKGNTEIGRRLSFFYEDAAFSHPYLGDFANMESYRMFVITPGSQKDSQLRTMTPSNVRRYGKTVTQNRIQNFHGYMLDGLWAYVNTYPELKQMIIESTLPFDEYYVKDTAQASFIDRPKGHDMRCRVFTELRDRLKRNDPPPTPDYEMIMKAKGMDFVLRK